MKILKRKCKNGLNQIQIFKPYNLQIIYSLWSEGEKFAFLETSYLLSSEDANYYENLSLTDNWYYWQRVE